MMHASSVDAQGMARMWPMASLRLQPGETVRFEPNGKHLMFTNLKMPLKAGNKVAVTFQFDKGEPPVTAQFTVRSAARYRWSLPRRITAATTHH